MFATHKYDANLAFYFNNLLSFFSLVLAEIWLQQTAFLTTLLLKTEHLRLKKFKWSIKIIFLTFTSINFMV